MINARCGFKFFWWVLMLSCLAILACSKQGHRNSSLAHTSGASSEFEGCTCPVAAGAPGARFWVMPESLKSIYEKSLIIKCSVKKYDGENLSGTDVLGGIYQVTTENSIEKSPFCISTLKGEKVNGQQVIFRKGNGNDEKWIGSAEYGSTIYKEITAGNYVKIGEADLQDVGRDHLYRVTRGLSQSDKWTYDLGGKIFQFIQSKWVCVGECNDYWITPENGKRLETLGLMSRGLDKNAKWCGVIDGVIYVEK